MILSILKGIGIVLLILIALIIFIVGTILFLPIKYRFEGNYQEMLNGEACIKWTPICLKVILNVKDNQVEYVIKMFSQVIMTNTDAKISWLGRKIFSSEKVKGRETENDECIQDSNILKNFSDDRSKLDAAGSKSGALKKKTEYFKTIEGDFHKMKKKRFSLSGKIRHFISKWKESLKSFWNNLKKIKRKKDELLKVYDSKRFEVAKKDVKAYIKEIFSIVKPGKLEGYIHFGMEDPAATGDVLGVLAMIYPLYQGFLTINPDFTEKCLDGALKGKGKIFLFSIVKLWIKVILNKNLIKVTKKVQTILEA